MKNDLISKADACEILADMYPTDGEAVISYKEIDKAYTKIRNLPTIDVAPVKHGRWINSGYACGENKYVCSVCGENEWRTDCRRMKYCMFCGAKMDLEGQDDATGI